MLNIFLEVTTALDIHLNYHFVPMIIIILGTYAIATTFFSVYDMAVDTIFLCFLVDLDKHDGSPDILYESRSHEDTGNQRRERRIIKELEVIDCKILKLSTKYF